MIAPSIIERCAERRAEVARLTRLGWNASDIAAALRITPRSVYRYRTQAGCGRPTPKLLTEDEVRTIEQLLAEGCSISEAARTVGRSSTTLYRHYRQFVWTPQQVAEHLSMCRQYRRLFDRPSSTPHSFARRQEAR